MAKPTSVDLITHLIKRRSKALEELEKHKNNPGQRVYWHTIAVEAGLLLGWICGDDFWMISARGESQALKAEAEALDIMVMPRYDTLESTVEYDSTTHTSSR